MSHRVFKFDLGEYRCKPLDSCVWVPVKQLPLSSRGFKPAQGPADEMGSLPLKAVSQAKCHQNANCNSNKPCVGLSNYGGYVGKPFWGDPEKFCTDEAKCTWFGVCSEDPSTLEAVDQLTGKTAGLKDGEKTTDCTSDAECQRGEPWRHDCRSSSNVGGIVDCGGRGQCISGQCVLPAGQ